MTDIKNPDINMKWYKKPGGIILLFFLFWPVGIYLMWKYTNWSRLIKWSITTILIVSQIFVYSIILLNPVTPDYSTVDLQAPKEPQKQQPVFSKKIGEEGFLRFSGNDAIPLPIAVTLEDYQTLKKVLEAKDEYGLLELASEGRLFGVSKGTKVRIIDKSGVLLKVRILEGVNPVDEDKIGRSGWVPHGWLYAQ